MQSSDTNAATRGLPYFWHWQHIGKNKNDSANEGTGRDGEKEEERDVE